VIDDEPLDNADVFDRRGKSADISCRRASCHTRVFPGFRWLSSSSRTSGENPSLGSVAIGAFSSSDPLKEKLRRTVEVFGAQQGGEVIVGPEPRGG
jgi:hypothetical protein